jgi:hypothetical protein
MLSPLLRKFIEQNFHKIIIFLLFTLSWGSRFIPLRKICGVVVTLLEKWVASVVEHALA